MSTAISIEKISKQFRIGVRRARGYRTLRESISEGLSSNWKRLRGTEERPDAAGNQPGTHWALRDVSFQVQSGEVVGVIGRNGAGKSTLLKILSRITEPTSGRAVIHGRVGSLLEVGTGFHPELTGRENIYLNGSILGMSHREIRSKFAEIVDFAEIEQFLDTPVKRYSSGMYVRLAFGVAAFLEPEILLVDEVLAVGDQKFQKKCLGKMREVGRSGRTVLFVSHNMAALESLCDRCVLIERGRVKADGETRSVLALYCEDDGDRASGSRDLSEHPGRTSGSTPIMARVTLGSGGQSPVSCLRAGSSLSIRAELDIQGAPFQPVLGVVIKTDLGASVFGVNNRFIPGFEFESVRGCAAISCHLDDLPLVPGSYLIDLFLGNENHDLDVIHEAISFDIVPSDVFGSGKLPPKGAGIILWPAAFELEAGLSSVSEADEGVPLSALMGKAAP
jgi:lipopolysaccharide transport system ATP-binding protein